MRWESSADNDVKLEKKREISNTNGRPILKLTNNYQKKKKRKKERKKEMEKENAGSHSQAANINNNNNINNNINNRRFWVLPRWVLPISLVSCHQLHWFPPLFHSKSSALNVIHLWMSFSRVSLIRSFWCFTFGSFKRLNESFQLPSIGLSRTKVSTTTEID